MNYFQKKSAGLALCTLAGTISIISPCNCSFKLRLEINGKLGIKVNKNKNDGGMAMIKL